MLFQLCQNFGFEKHLSCHLWHIGTYDPWDAPKP